MKKIVQIIPVLFAAVYLYSCAAKSEAPQQGPAPAEVMQVTAGEAVTEQDYTAAIEGKVNVDIRPQVEGYLEKIYVDEGAFVKAGQPLFRINDAPFREQINNAQASLHMAEAAMLNAQLEIDRLTPLVTNKVVSDMQLKTAQASYKAAKASVEQAKAAVASARINLGYTLISAPVSGYIGRLPRKQGALVSRTDPEALTRISDVHEIYAYFSLSETDFIRFKDQYPGATLEEKLKELPPVSLVLADNSLFPVQGRIDMIDGQFDRNTGAITLRAVFPNEKGLVRSGNTGRIRLSRLQQNTVLVPQSATVDMQDKVFVFTVGAGNKVSRQAIQVSGASGGSYLVSSGLKPGDRIVLSGLDHLQEGAVIKPEAPADGDKKLSMKH